jgi:hypothetical protein
MNSASPSSYMLRRQQRILREMKFVKPLPPKGQDK